MADRKILSRRKMFGLESEDPAFTNLEGAPPLSTVLGYHLLPKCPTDKVYFCGDLAKMTREYMTEPIGKGWKFARQFVFKHRTAVYLHEESERKVTVKLASHREGWFPGVSDMDVACNAWEALKAEWHAATNLPLLSSPAATGKALLWETLPKDQSFPSLPDDLARLIRSNSPQHRLELFSDDESALYQYDGRWMYAAMCGLDRFPVGEPRRVGHFKPYEPGWHFVEVKIPNGWNHIGLLPAKSTIGGWDYPSMPGLIFKTWASEPELTLALSNGWEIVEHYDGWAFDKGRPLEGWSKKLIDLRAKFQEMERNEPTPDIESSYKFAAAAIRQILNHAIGSMHVDGYERELFVPDSEWRQWRRDNAEWFSIHHRDEEVEGGHIVSQIVPSQSKLDIYMPHWSATIYALSRARVAQWALKCDPSTLVKINGDAIYSTAPLPFEDNGRLGQLRRKES